MTPDDKPNATGWFKATRSPDALELIDANPLAFVLAYIIAFRARWSSGFNRHNLQPGEALVGDFHRYGMSAREYRTAKQQLAKWNFATFKTTNKGTIAKLTDTRLFDVLNEAGDKQPDNQPTGKRQASDRQPTTNEEGKEGKTVTEYVADVSGTDAVELPPGFPATADEAKAAAGFVGCPEEFAAETWNKARGRGGRDARDVPIRSWRHYVASEWRYQQQRDVQSKPTTSAATITRTPSSTVKPKSQAPAACAATGSKLPPASL